MYEGKLKMEKANIENVGIVLDNSLLKQYTMYCEIHKIPIENIAYNVEIKTLNSRLNILTVSMESFIEWFILKDFEIFKLYTIARYHDMMKILKEIRFYEAKTNRGIKVVLNLYSKTLNIINEWSIWLKDD